MENRRIDRNNRKVDKKRRTITLIKTFILDIVITGLCLVIFALFHHVIPASKATVGRQLPAPTQQITQEPRLQHLLILHLLRARQIIRQLFSITDSFLKSTQTENLFGPIIHLSAGT